MVDLMVARTRLGEPFWPISNELRRTALVLENKGYVEIFDGHVSGTFRIQLSPKAVKSLITDSTYTSPLVRQIATHIADSLEMSGGDPTTIRMIRTHWSDR